MPAEAFMDDGLYPIRAVSRLTGISADNIRAWERRYAAVSPQRTKGGRLFSEADLARLRLLKQAVDNGHSIGRIATLDDESLARLPLKSDGQATGQDEARPPLREVERIIGLVADYEITEAARALGKLAAFLSTREFILEIVVPLMHRIGLAWSKGILSVAQEHLASAIVRDAIGMLIRQYHRDDAGPRLLFATPAGELHEFGILSAALLAAESGLGVIYLGCNLPKDDLVRAAQRTKPRAVVLGVIDRTDSERGNRTYFKQLRRELPEKIDLLAGGHFGPKLDRTLTTLQIPMYLQLETFETKLVQYGAIL